MRVIIGLIGNREVREGLELISGVEVVQHT